MARDIRNLLVATSVLGFVAAGCACGGPGSGTGDDDGIHDDDDGGCSDFDGDEYGVGRDCLGPDECDSIPQAHTADQCAEICEEYGNLAPGCECSAVEPEICYFGPSESLGIGACRAGIMVCADGVWGPCDGQVLPSEEVCDEADNNCDGVVDEGVLSDCGNCNFDCEEDCIGVGCDDAFDPDGDGASGVVLTPEGGITLDGETTITNTVIWIANSSEGTVTKINTRTREEEGRYRTGPAGGGGWGLSPSRTTVNLHGDVVVANRGNVGEATRYNASDCPDADGDGRVETSDGRFDVYDWMDDECWIWSTPVGSGARGSGFEIRIGLDGVVEEYVWVGDYGHMDIHEIEAETGELTGRTIAGVTPYGLAIGKDNSLWTFDGGRSALAWVTTTDRDLEKNTVPLPVGESWYGITVDPDGRVWIGSSVARYDPELDEWESPEGPVTGGGIACDADGNAYIGEAGGGWGAGGPWKIDGETLETEQLLDGVGGHGYAIDADGYIWSVEFSGSHVYVTDPDTLEKDWEYDGLVGAYTYSDMTGLQLLQVIRGIGVYPAIFEACPDQEVTWAELDWEGVTPPGTSLAFTAKTANDLPGLAAAMTLELGMQPPLDPPIDLGSEFDDAGIEHGNLVQIEVTLSSAGEEAPILNSLRVSHSCLFIVE